MVNNMFYEFFNYCLVKWFNFYYRIRPPEMVKYWLRDEKQDARMYIDKDGSQKMEIRGEKYPLPGFPRGHLMHNPVMPEMYPVLSRLKHQIKNRLFNDRYAEIEKLVEEGKYDFKPPERMQPAIREIWETFEKLETMEVTEDMRLRVALIKKVLCFIMEEDDAYRYRFQMFLWLINQDKVKPSKADMYFLRGKYYKADRFVKILGRVFDKFLY